MKSRFIGLQARSQLWFRPYLLAIDLSLPEMLSSPRHSCTLFKEEWCYCSRPLLPHPQPIRWNIDPYGFGGGRAERVGFGGNVGGFADCLADVPVVYYITERFAPLPDVGTRRDPPLFTVWWVSIQMHTCRGFVHRLWGLPICQKETSVTTTIIRILN